MYNVALKIYIYTNLANLKTSYYNCHKEENIGCNRFIIQNKKDCFLIDWKMNVYYRGPQ